MNVTPAWSRGNTGAQMTELEIVHAYLDYSKETGEFRWKKASSDKSKIGAIAGRPRSKNGYWQLTLKGKTYYSHRLAWFFVNEVMPSFEIDHINGIKGDNRIANLRDATHSQNLVNMSAKKDNTSGSKNAHWCNTKQRWIAKVKFGGKTYHAGTFRDYLSAVSAAESARLDVHGKFASQLGCERDAAMVAWPYRGVSGE